MKIVFISMNTLGKNCLEELIRQKSEIAAVFTLKEEFAKNVSDFEKFDVITSKAGIPLFKVKNINDSENIEKIREIMPEMIFVIGWSQILSKELLEIPEKKCVGMHPSLLPKNRGRAAIPWQILNHEKESGLSLFFLGDGIDNGGIIAQKRFSLRKNETAASFYKKAVAAGRQIMRESFPLLLEGKIVPKKQDESLATYLPKRTPEDGKIDWNKNNEEIYDLIRATTKPYPGAFSFYRGKKAVFWSAEKARGKKAGPGEITGISKKGVVVSCGNGSILIKQIEIEGSIKKTGFFKVNEKFGD